MIFLSILRCNINIDQSVFYACIPSYQLTWRKGIVMNTEGLFCTMSTDLPVKKILTQTDRNFMLRLVLWLWFFLFTCLKPSFCGVNLCASLWTCDSVPVWDRNDDIFFHFCTFLCTVIAHRVLLTHLSQHLKMSNSKCLARLK